MANDITIGIVASAREWRSVLQAHVRDHVAGVRVQILREPRMALELQLDVVVIDDVSSFLTRDKVIRLRERGTRVVGIYDPDENEGLGISFLENLGVDLSLPSNISPEEMINAVSQLQPRENYSHTFDHVVADFSTGAVARAQETNATMVAVSGPAGTGSTEIAIALADVLVSRRQATLLLDCDEVGPSVARRLGFHLHPNVLSAIDAVSNVTRPLTEMVGRPTDRTASAVNFDVIPGIASSEDWAQMRSMDLEDLFIAARKSWKYIVCNTGPFAEDLSGYGIERFGATRATLEKADVIIGVMLPTPTGYMRFLDWIASIRTLGADRAVYVVVNRAPKSAYIRGEIESQLSRDVDSRFIAGLFFVPEDERVTKAEWEGQRVHKGPFLTGVAEVASYALPMSYKKGKKGKAIPAYTPQQTGGYPPEYGQQPDPFAQASPPPVNVSWDDPDIANPSAQAYAAPAPVAPAPAPAPVPAPVAPEVPLSLDEVAPTYHTEPPSVQPVADVSGIENSLTQSLAEPYQVPGMPVADVDTHPYSFSPPQHSVDEFLPSSLADARTPMPDMGDGYVPAFKRGMNDSDTANTASSEPAEAVSPPMYTSVETPAPEAESGYVPHFMDEANNDEDDDNFWGQP